MNSNEAWCNNLVEGVPRPRYVFDWIENEKDTDVIFGKPKENQNENEKVKEEEEEEDGRLISTSHQPWEHCQSQYFPTIARHFGLKRYFTDHLGLVPQNGLQCALPCSEHSRSIPSFMYTSVRTSPCPCAPDV